MKKTIQIPEGNEFSLFIPFVVFSASGREDASAALWNDLQVVVRMSNSTANVDCTYSVQAQYVVVSFGNDLKRSSYDVIISGEYERRKVCAPLNNHFAITAWADGNYAEFVVGQPIICPTQTIIGQFNTTQDIEDLTEELRAALVAAEAAKAEYEEKVEELENVAQQGDNPDATNTAILTAIGNISIDTTTIAKQGTNASATLTATQTAATNAYASAEAAKTATIDGNDTAVGVAKEIRGEVGTGSDTAAETGTLFAVIKWVKDKVKSIFNLIGSPASGQPATLFAAIAAGGGGGGGDAQESTSQAILAKVDQIIDGNILHTNYDGWIYDDGYDPASGKISDILSAYLHLRQIEDYSLAGSFSNTLAQVVLWGSPKLVSATFHNIDIVEGAYTHNGIARTAGALTLSFPNATIFNGSLRAFQGVNYLYRLLMPKVTSFSTNTYTLWDQNQLIDIEVGEVNTSFSMAVWGTYAGAAIYSTTSSSLVESGEPFANNLEKLLYNIREHIAAKIADRTGQSALTITFHANMKAVINADATTAAAFANKNWTIA